MGQKRRLRADCSLRLVSLVWLLAHGPAYSFSKGALLTAPPRRPALPLRAKGTRDSWPRRSKKPLFSGEKSDIKPLSLQLPVPSPESPNAFSDDSLADAEGSTSLLDASSAYQVPEDDSDLHLALVVAGTLWWYIYTTSFMLESAPAIFGLSEDLVRVLGVYVTFSQLLVYAGCYRLARAETLFEAQLLVTGMTTLCVPADVIATLVNPTGSKGITILAFAEITFFFGTFLAHYLRKASYREIPPSDVVESKNECGIVESLICYRPPTGIQATHMATDFTRSFVAFTIAAGSVGELLAGSESLDPVALGSLVVVVLHTAMECALTTIFPGANLQQYTSFLVAEIVLYSIHMLAASIATIQTIFGTSLIDQALFIWLFGSATAKVIFKIAALLGKINFDAKLGLSNLDRSQ